jgi:hypothetical protein
MDNGPTVSILVHVVYTIAVGNMGRNRDW